MTAVVDERTKQLKRAKALRNSHRLYAKTAVRIVNKDTHVVPFVFNIAQEKIDAAEQAAIAAGLPIRIIVLKPRQIGMSTFTQSWLSHKAFTRTNQTCFTIADSDITSQEMFEKTESIYDMYPKALVEAGMRPEKSKARKGEMIKFGAPNFSKMLVETANNVKAGRGFAIHWLHCSEVAYWKDAETTMAGLLAGMPNRPDTGVIVESTAKGMGGWFYDQWQAAVAGESVFTPIFIAWWEFPEYARDARDGDAPLSDEEKKIQDRFGLRLEQMLWRRDKLSELGSIKKFMIDFPATPEEAFISAGERCFDLETMESHADLIRADKSPVDWRNIQVDEEKKTVHFRKHSSGQLALYEKPRKKQTYLITADIATGKGRDRSAILVGKFMPDGDIDVVAAYRGKHTPTEMAYILNALSIQYNGALMAPERNGPGTSTVETLVKLGAKSRLLRQKRIDNKTKTQSKEYGFLTSTKSRPTMMVRLVEYVENHHGLIRDARLLEELRTLVLVTKEYGEKIEADDGCFDDMVMALAILSFVSQGYVGIKQKAKAKQSDENPSTTNAWRR